MARQRLSDTAEEFKEFTNHFWRPSCPACNVQSTAEYINCSHWTCRTCYQQFCGVCLRGYAPGDRNHEHADPCYTYYKQMGSIRKRVQKKGFREALGRYTTDHELNHIMDGISQLRSQPPSAAERNLWWGAAASSSNRQTVLDQDRTRDQRQAAAARRQATAHQSLMRPNARQLARRADMVRDRAKRQADRNKARLARQSKARLSKMFTNTRDQAVLVASDTE